MSFFIRCFIFFLYLSGTIHADEIVSCRAWTAGMTECNPYERAFIYIKKHKTSNNHVHNRVIARNKMPIKKHVKIRANVTLSGIVKKYIKREERLYRVAKHRKENKITEENALPQAEKNTTHVQVIVANITKNGTKRGHEEFISAESEVVVDGTKNILLVEINSTKTYDNNLSVESDDISVDTESLDTVVKSISLQKEKDMDDSSKVYAFEKVEEETEMPIASVVIYKPEAKKSEIVFIPAADKNTSILVVNENTKIVNNQINEPKKEDFAEYIVKKGDSLGAISHKFGINIDSISKLNNLNKKKIIHIKQKIKIPLSKELASCISKAEYKVKIADTLSKIAKKFSLTTKILRKYNKLGKNGKIYIGQKLMLPLAYKLAEIKREKEKKRKARLRKKRERERLARLALQKAERKKFLKISKNLKRKLSVVATAYTSHRGQTDKTPFLAAWNNRIRPGMKIIAVSRDLIYKYGITNGSKVRIAGLKGIYTVRDKMNKKWKKKIDIYMGTSRWRALRWGRRRVTIYY